MPRNNDGEALLPVATSEELERAYRNSEISFRDMPFPRFPRLTDIAGELPVRALQVYDRYVAGPLTWDNNAVDGLRQRAAISFHGDTHDNLALNAEELAEDQRHREVVERWQTGDANPDETARLRIGVCPCRSCLESTFRRIATAVGLPAGYQSTCFCGRCVAWRRNVALRIQEYLVSGQIHDNTEVPTMTIRVDNRMTDMADALAMSMDASLTREQLRRQPPPTTGFDRQRASRGHPVKQQALAAGWAPNAWEA